MDSAEQTHFEYLVIGTGLRQSLLAAALAKSGHSVLHVDEQPYYGEGQATLSLKELVAWSKAQSITEEASVDVHFTGSGTAELPPELAHQARRYNITLCPTIYPSIGPFITTLVRSGVAKYTAFRLLDVVALYNEGKLGAAATTKEDIFKDTSLSLIEKRRVMKFVMAANSDDEISEATGDEELSLNETLEQKYSLYGRLKEMIMYAAALAVSEQGSMRFATSRLRKYVRSTGKYGKSPFLLGQYGGIGEIVQGFCRISAVFGGTYMLGRPIQHLSETSSNAPASIQFAEDENYTADCVIKVDANADVASQLVHHRGIVILSRPIRLQQSPTPESDDGNVVESGACENALFIIPPGRLSDKIPAAPVSALMAGEGSFSCPSGQYVTYLSTLADQNSSLRAKDCLQPCLEALMQASSEQVTADDVIMSVYYSDKAPNPLTVSRHGLSHQISQAADLTAQIGLAELCDTAVEEATTCYKHVTGHSDLFVPTEDEGEDIEDM